MAQSIPSTNTTNNPNTPLPAILCLHGGGSTSTVFKIQCRRLIWQLSGQFRFVFAQGPHEGPPGHGMLPTFASCAPFRRWVRRKFIVGESDREPTPASEIDDVDATLLKIMEDNGGVESFVGVLGFSQGARLVPGLLLRQKIEERESEDPWSGEEGTSRWKFKFGVMVGGPFPPISLAEEVDVKDYVLLKQVPTVHAWGREDHIREGCEEMYRLCESSDHCFQMDFDGGHHMPLKDVEAKDLCDLIRAAWYASGGRYGVGVAEKY